MERIGLFLRVTALILFAYVGVDRAAAQTVLCAPSGGAAATNVTSPQSGTIYTLDSRGCATFSTSDAAYFQTQGYRVVASSGGGGSLAAGAAITGCPAQSSLFVTSALQIGCVAAVSQADSGNPLTSTGSIVLPATGTVGATSLNFGTPGTGIFGTSTTVQFSSGGALQGFIGASQLSLSNNINLVMSTGNNLNWNADTSLSRSGAGVLRIGTSVNTATGSLLLTNITPTGAIINTGITTDSGQAATSTVCQDSTTHQYYFGSGTAGICKGTSSARFKDGIAPLAAGLDQIMALDPVSYYAKPGYGDPARRLYGLTAEQMETVIPDLIWRDAGGPSSLDYVGLIPVLVRAIQQQQAEIEALKRKLN